MGENNELRNRFMVVNIPENVEIFTPTSSGHPRQKYLLTVKGLAIYNSKQ